tara:strand:+ start:3294 stop:3650 length:357 start_codon:yes stop_codon:yes gene_type:complete
MNEINKDELLDLTKWQRFFFMVLYSFAINGVVGILIIIAAVQFFFYLFTSKINNQLQTANNWLHGFFSDSLNFLSFNTDSKPWPFNDKTEATDSNEDVEVVDGESEDLLGKDQPEQTT